MPTQLMESSPFGALVDVLAGGADAGWCERDC